MTKNKLAAIIGIAVIILLAVSLWVNVKQYKTNRKQSDRIVALSNNTSNGNAVITTRYMDKDSGQHAVAKEIPVKNDAEKTLAVGAGYTDTVVRALKVALNQITELTKVNAALTANVKLRTATSVPAAMDSASLPAVLKTHTDKYLSLTYRPDNDSLTLNYNVALNQAQYWKRTWLFGAKTYYVDFWSDDPRVNINNAKRFTTNFPTAGKRFGLGISAGYGYIPALNKGFPYIGASINYNIFQF